MRGDQGFPVAGVHAVQIIHGVANRISRFGLHDEANEPRVEIEVGQQNRGFQEPRRLDGGVAGEAVSGK